MEQTAESGIGAANKAKTSKPVAQKTAKGNKKSGAGKAVAIFFVFVLLAGAIVIGFMAVNKNLFGGRDALLAYLQSLEPSYVAMQERETAATELETELAAKQEELEKKSLSLDTLAEQLSQREILISNGGETRTVESLTLFTESLTEEKLKELKKVGTICSAMLPESAAKTIAALGQPLDMALVIYYMEPEKAAETLAVMDAALSAEIVQTMLG